MSEKFLISPAPLLDTLSKEMLYRLNHYPMLAVNYEKIEYFCSRLQLLFNGDFRPIKFETTLLHNCITQYCKCLLIFIQDNVVTMKKDEVDYLHRWLSVLDNLGDVDSIKNKFTFLVPFLKIIIYEDLPLWVKKEFILHLNRIFKKPTRLIFSEKEKQFFFVTKAIWLKLLTTCGDYEFQTILVEAIVSPCELCHIEEVLRGNFDDTNIYLKFFEVYRKQNYANDVKTLLIAINGCFGNVRSVPCLKVTLEETVIPPIKGTNSDTTWMHVNYGFHTLSFGCHRDSLRSLPGTTNHSDFYEFVTVNFEDIGKICLLINTDSKTVNSVGGIFLINLTGKCSCRFDSSKEIVSSIKKIIFTVPNGSHLQYLKEAFTKLFGKRFKEDSSIPIKKKNFLDKKDSPLSSSTQNLSHQAKNRRMKKRNDLTMSPGSFFKQNLKLENSLTLKNKECEDTQDCFLYSTDSLFKKNVDINKETTNLQSKFINNKENEILGNLSKKGDYKNKNDIEDSENCQLFISPDTTTYQFMNDKKTGSITSPHSTSKSFEKEKGGHGTTKKKLSLLKNLDIDILTTSKNKKKPESSRIVVLPTTEETNSPSNYKFGEDNSLSILEENKSFILDFINHELNSIPDLRSPLGLKNKSDKIKTSKAQKVKHTCNYAIADSSSMEANSSISKTISNAKVDGLRFGVTHTESFSEESQLNDLQKSFHSPENTYKCKKNTSLVTSNNLLKHLAENHKKDRENRRIQNEEGIDKTVNRLLHSSETFKSDFLCARSKENEIIDYVGSNYNLHNENKARGRNALNMKMPDSCAFQNTEEILNTKKSKLNKNLISNIQFEFYNGKKPIKIDHNYSLENNEVTNEKGIDNEIENEEKSEYYSITQDDVPPEGNKKSNQTNNYFESSTLNLKKQNPLRQLINMNTEEIGNVGVIYKKETENDDFLTLNNDTVNFTESEYYSINPDDFPIRNNSATPDLDIENEKEKKTKIFKSHPLKKLMLMNSEEIINLSVEEKSDVKVNGTLVTLDQQILRVEGRDYYSITNEDNTSFENNSITPNVDLNLFKSTNIANPVFNNDKLKKLNKFDYSKNKQEVVIEQDKNKDVMLGQQESEFYLFNPDITSTENNEISSRIRNSESLEFNFNFGNNESIATPNMGNKNRRISKASSLELSKINNNCTLKNITEQSVENEESLDLELTVRRVNSAEENENFSNIPGYQESNQSNKNSETPDLDLIFAYSTNIGSELKNINENTNEELSINNVRLSTETVKINNWSFPSDIPEDIALTMSLRSTEEQMRNYDDISIISISSTEEIDSDASTAVLDDLQTYSFEKEQIECNHYDGVLKTDADMKMQIPEIIQDGCKTQNEGDDHLTIISISSGTHSESIKNGVTKNKQIKNSFVVQEKIENNTRYDAVKTNTDVQNLQIIEINDSPEEIIQDGTEKQKDGDDHVIIICTSSTERSLSDNRLDNKATGINHTENVQNKTTVKINADAQKLQIPEISVISEEIIEDVNEKQEDTDDPFIISILSTELDNYKATGISHPENVINKTTNNEASEHNSFTEKIEIAIKYDDILETNSDITKIQILEINDTIRNDHCYSSNQPPKHEIATKTKNDHFIKSASCKSKDSPSPVDHIDFIINDTIRNYHCYSSNQPPKHEIAKKTKNDDHFIKSASNKSKGSPSPVDHIDFELTQLTSVPILLNEINYQEKAGTISNNVLDLNRTNFDVSVTDLLDKHQERLNRSSESIAEFENSFKSTTFKSMEHISSNISCDERNAFDVRNKINILSNIRIAPPFYNKINQSHNDVHLLNEKYVAVSMNLQESKNEITRLQAELVHKTQKLEELERINKETLEKTHNLEVCGKKSVTSEKSKQTKERITSKSKDNFEISSEKFDKINSFQEFIESPHNRLPDNNFLLDKFMNKSLQSQANSIEKNIFEESNEETNYFQTLDTPLKGLSTKKLLRNKFKASQCESTKSTPNTNTSMKSDFEMLIARNELTRELELSPKKALFDMVATNEKKNVTPLIHKLQKSHEFSFQEEFASFSFHKSSSNQSATKENKSKFSQDGEISDFEKFKIRNEKISDGKEGFLTSASQKRLSDKTAASDAEKKIKLAKGVQLSCKIHKPKEDSFAKFTFERSPFKKCNEHKNSTSSGELIQKMRKSEVCDLEMMETESKELYQSREFVSIRKASEKSFAANKAEAKTLTDVQATPEMHKSRNVNEDLNFIQVFDSIPDTPRLHKGEPVKVKKLIEEVQSKSRKQKSKENSFKKLEVINEEFGLLTKQSTLNGNELNKNIQFDFDDIQTDNGGLYNLISKPHKLYEKSDKTGKTFKVDPGIRNKRNEVHRDEHYYNTVDKIYGLDAMLSALTSYLKTVKSPKESKNKKPQKKRIVKMKLGTHKKAKSKQKKKNSEKFF